MYSAFYLFEITLSLSRKLFNQCYNPVLHDSNCIEIILIVTVFVIVVSIYQNSTLAVCSNIESLNPHQLLLKTFKCFAQVIQQIEQIIC